MIIELLELSEYIGVSKTIDKAKGYNKIPTSIKEGLDHVKRQKAWLRKR